MESLSVINKFKFRGKNWLLPKIMPITLFSWHYQQLKPLNWKLKELKTGITKKISCLANMILLTSAIKMWVNWLFNFMGKSCVFGHQCSAMNTNTKGNLNTQKILMNKKSSISLEMLLNFSEASRVELVLKCWISSETFSTFFSNKTSPNSTLKQSYTGTLTKRPTVNLCRIMHW